MFRFRLFALLCIFSVFLSACTTYDGVEITPLDMSVAKPEEPQEGATKTRAHPGQVHWLESQSLLNKTNGLAAIVSGSGLSWNAPSNRSEYAALLECAPVWFHLNPLYASWRGSVPLLEVLAGSNTLAALAQAGVHGVYLAPLAESGLTYGVDSALQEGALDLVSFEPAEAFGGMRGYARVENKATAANIILGGDILPSATGLGPDFSLAAKGVRDYPGLYMMVDIPLEFWDFLPLQRHTGSSAGQIIDKNRLQNLIEAGLIPPAFSRDNDKEFTHSGWAVTPESAGIDGVPRRWIYRYAGSPLRPILNWDDPSGTARKVFSASIIQQVGLLHQPLVGLSVEALWGQDPAPADNIKPSPEPALSALRTMSREVRRYGAWTMLRDDIPAHLLPLVQEADVDFCKDTITSPQLEYAMLTGDTAPLKKALAQSLKDNINHARLWRQTIDTEGVNFNIAGLSGAMAVQAMTKKSGLSGADAPLKDNILYITPATLASVVSGADNAATTEEADDLIDEAHLLQIAFRLMQPGLFFLSGQDIEGSLAGGTSFASHVGWSLDGGKHLVTRHGLPANTGIRPPLEQQLRTSGIFISKLQRLFAIREKTKVASGKLAGLAVMGEDAAVGVVTQLPDGNVLLCAANFSGNSFITDVDIPSGLIRPGANGLDLITENNVAVSGDSMRLRMAPWQFRLVKLAGK